MRLNKLLVYIFTNEYGPSRRAIFFFLQELFYVKTKVNIDETAIFAGNEQNLV